MAQTNQESAGIVLKVNDDSYEYSKHEKEIFNLEKTNKETEVKVGNTTSVPKVPKKVATPKTPAVQDVKETVEVEVGEATVTSNEVTSETPAVPASEHPAEEVSAVSEVKAEVKETEDTAPNVVTNETVKKLDLGSNGNGGETPATPATAASSTGYKLSAFAESVHANVSDITTVAKTVALRFNSYINVRFVVPKASYYVAGLMLVTGGVFVLLRNNSGDKHCLLHVTTSGVTESSCKFDGDVFEVGNDTVAYAEPFDNVIDLK